MNENKVAYLVGIICGDGYVSSQGSLIEVKAEHQMFLKNVYAPLVKKLFNITPRIIPESSGKHAYRCYFNSILVVNLLKSWNIVSPKTYIVCAPLWIKESNIKTKINFVRGVMDSDGTISTKRNRDIINYPTIALQSRSEKLVEDVTNMLIETGLNAKQGSWNKRGKPMFMVRLYGFKQLDEYMNKISFRHPFKLKKALNILKTGILRADRSMVE